MQRRETQRHRRVKQKVIIITRIIKWRRRSPRDKFPGRRIQKLARKTAPGEIHSLREINRSTQIALHKPCNPERTNFTQRAHSRVEESNLTQDIHKRDVLLSREIDNHDDHAKHGAEEREDEEIVEDEEGV